MRTGDAFPSNFLKAADLNGKAVRVTIESVTMEKIGEDRKPALHFVGKDKALILNVTNSNRIEEATKTDEMDDWAGWSITLYSCKVDYQGKRVDAIRVDDRPGSSRAPAKPEPTRAAQRASSFADADGPPPGVELPPEALDDSDIPFAWLLPLVLPALGLFGSLLMVA